MINYLSKIHQRYFASKHFFRYNALAGLSRWQKIQLRQNPESIFYSGSIPESTALSMILALSGEPDAF